MTPQHTEESMVKIDILGVLEFIFWLWYAAMTHDLAAINLMRYADARIGSLEWVTTHCGHFVLAKANILSCSDGNHRNVKCLVQRQNYSGLNFGRKRFHIFIWTISEGVEMVGLCNAMQKYETTPSLNMHGSIEHAVWALPDQEWTFHSHGLIWTPSSFLLVSAGHSKVAGTVCIIVDIIFFMILALLALQMKHLKRK